MADVDTKRVLAIVGSPRKGGNTDILIGEILKGAKDAGAEVEKVMISDFKIAPCKACAACRKAGVCIQKDDWPDLLEKMEASGVWVLGTPVYWWGPTAQLKAFVDRWYSRAAAPWQKHTFAGRRVVLAVPMGDTDPETGRHVVGMFQDALDYIGADLFAAVLAPGAYDKGDIKSNTEVLEQARRTGADAVTSLR
jgi:multimeric flavodoxin WrbA